MATMYREKLDNLKATYHSRLGQQTAISTATESLRDTVQELSTLAYTQEQSRFLLTKVAEQARETARQHLESTVTDALQYVFGPDFSFVIELKEARGRAEAEFYVESTQNGKRVRTDPLQARGGGVVDIIAIALQFGIVQIHDNPKIQGPILMDEPGKHVDQENTVRLAMFLSEMSKLFGRQIGMVTHQPHLAEIADNSYNIELKGGKSIAIKRLQSGTASQYQSDNGSFGDDNADGAERTMPEPG